MDDLKSNVIDLQARVARLRAEGIADNAASALGELTDLRTTLRNLNLILQLQLLAGSRSDDFDSIDAALDEIAASLVECVRLLGVETS